VLQTRRRAPQTFEGLEPVYIATTPEEREAIWEFRYRVYVEEMGRKLGRDAEGRPWVHDPEDERPSTYQLYTLDDDGVSSVMRVRFWAPGEVPAADFELFSMERFPGIEEIGTGELGRLMVRPTARGALLMGALLNAAYEIGVGELDARIAFLNCAPSLVRLYRKLGARPYDGRLIPTPDGVEVPMILVLSDIETMTKVRSCVLPLAEHYFGPGGKQRLDTAPFAHLLEAERMPLEIDPGGALARMAEQQLDDVSGTLVDWLSRDCIEKLSTEGLVLSVPAGGLLTEKGLGQRDMFIVLDGLFEAVDGDRRLGVSGPGDVIGEMAYFSSDGRRTASVRASTDGRVLLLRKGFVEKLRRREPACAAEILFQLARVVADRSAPA
jgi:hypothetical protein